MQTGRSVQRLDADGAGVRLRSEDGQITANLALLATGKHELRGRQRAGQAPDVIGFKQHFRLADAQHQALLAKVEIVLFDGGYAGLQLIEGGSANLCLVVTRDRYAGLGRNWRRLLDAVPHLARRLDGAQACWPKPLAIYRIPYGYLHAGEEQGSVYRVGDQAAVIPSFTGDGMAMALHSARLASDAVLAGHPPAVYHQEIRTAFRRPLQVAGVVAAMGATTWLQPLMTAACRLAPRLLTGLAAQTRIRAA